MKIMTRLAMLLLSLSCLAIQADGYYPNGNTTPNVPPQKPPSSSYVNSATRYLQATNDLITALDATIYKKFADSHT